MAKKKSYCYTDKKGKKRCTKSYIIRKDRTPYVQDPETGYMIGRARKQTSSS